MTPIEHFLTDIMQISFTHWIENSIADIGCEKADATDIFQLTLRNFYLKTLAGRYCFFYGSGSFRVLVLHINVQCRLARFFCASSTDVLFRPKLACSHLFGQENISPPRQKIFANRLHAYFIQGLNRKLNSWQRSWNRPDWNFSADIAQLFFKNVRWQKMFFFTAEEVF